MYKPDEIAVKQVYQIDVSGSQIGVSYYVMPFEGATEEGNLYRTDKPHQDFFEAAKPVLAIAKKWLEIPMETTEGKELKLKVDKIKFVESKKFGHGVKIKCRLCDLKYSDENISLQTPTYYTDGTGMGMDENHAYEKQKMTKAESNTFYRLAEEAFAYAYYGKREQPTVGEAQDAYEAGGWPEELGEVDDDGSSI